MMDWLQEHDWIRYALALAVGVLVYKALGPVFGSKRRLHKAAQDANQRHEVLFNSGFRWAKVDPASYPHLDHAYYAKATESMAKLGFEPVGDVEYLHVTQGSPAMPTFVRVFADQQGEAYGAAFHIRVRGLNKWLLKLAGGDPNMRVMEFNTSLSNGHYILSVNTANSPGLTHPKEFHYRRYPAAISARALLERHRETVAQLCRGREQDPVPRRVTSLEAILEQEAHQHEAEQGYRNQAGAINDEELARLAPHLTDQERKDYLQELERSRK